MIEGMKEALEHARGKKKLRETVCEYPITEFLMGNKSFSQRYVDHQASQCVAEMNESLPLDYANRLVYKTIVVDYIRRAFQYGQKHQAER